MVRFTLNIFKIIKTMSGATALFGNTAGRNQSKNLVEFKAGKMNMRGKMVYPDKRKGLLYIHQSDDSLIHFCWKDRSSGVVEDVSCYLLYLNYLIMKYDYRFLFKTLPMYLRIETY